jgi:hypothetical protein
MVQISNTQIIPNVTSTAINHATHHSTACLTIGFIYNPPFHPLQVFPEVRERFLQTRLPVDLLVALCAEKICHFNTSKTLMGLVPLLSEKPVPSLPFP